MGKIATTIGRDYLKVITLIFLIMLCLSVKAQVKSVSHGGDEFFIADTTYTASLSSKINVLLEKTPPRSVTQLSSSIGKHPAKSSRLPVANTKNLSPEEIYQQVKKSVLLVGVFTIDKNGNYKPEIIASAYPISEDGLCVTNFHVLRSIIQSQKTKIDDSTFYFVENYNGTIFFIDELLGSDESNDVAMFRIRSDAKSLTAIPLGVLAPVGSKVYCVSNPENNYYFFSEGIVSRNYVRRVDMSKPSSPLKYTMGISADYSGGSSGAPIVNQKGNLVGMVSSTYVVYSGVNNHGQLQMVLKNAIPLNVIQSLLK